MPSLLSVPRLWPGETIACVACGPSLTQADVARLRGWARVIVVNNAYTMAPWADVLYAADTKWWVWHRGVPSFAGLKYTVMPEAGKWPRVQVIKQTGTTGLELKPTGLKTGQHSGYQAINLAVHLGASRIVLLGYDLQRGPKGEEHFFGFHPNRGRSPLDRFRRHYDSLVAPMAAAGIEMVNCSRRTSLTCFPRQSLDELLQPAQVAYAS